MQALIAPATGFAAFAASNSAKPKSGILSSGTTFGSFASSGKASTGASSFGSFASFAKQAQSLGGYAFVPLYL